MLSYSVRGPYMLSPAEHTDTIHCYLFKGIPVVSSLEIYPLFGQPMA